MSNKTNSVGGNFKEEKNRIDECEIEKSECLEKCFMVCFKCVYWVMLQNIFLTVNLVKRLENPCIEAIFIDYPPSLILQKVLLGSNSKIISVGKHLESCNSESIISWGPGVGVQRWRVEREALKYTWKNGGH